MFKGNRNTRDRTQMQTTEAGRDSSVSLMSKKENKQKAHRHGWQVQTAIVLSPQSCRYEQGKVQDTEKKQKHKNTL